MTRGELFAIVRRMIPGRSVKRSVKGSVKASERILDLLSTSHGAVAP